MKSVVYMDTNKAYIDDLRVKSTLTELLVERATVYGKGVRSNIRMWSTAIVFAGLSLTWVSIANSVYVQEIGKLPFWKMFFVSGLNLSLVFFGTLVGYLTVYNLLKTVTHIALFSKGKYFQRKAKGYSTLYYKASMGAFTDLFFESEGAISKVTVSNYYASLFNVGDKVPTMYEYVMFNNGVRVKVVRECVGSRANSFADLKFETEFHFVDGQEDAHNLLQERLNGTSGKPMGITHQERSHDYAIASQYAITSSSYGR